jgi:GNAT superfamily N-acetyltransferase
VNPDPDLRLEDEHMNTAERHPASDAQIRKLSPAEMPEALKLVGDTFLEFEAPDYSLQGIDNFMECLNDKAFIGGLVFYGAFINGLLAGVLATRNDGSHIAMFFVRKDHHRQGIGRRLFEYMRRFCPGARITVNSSPYAVPIYTRLGFTPTDTEQVSGGIRYTPMEYPVSNS